MYLKPIIFRPEFYKDIEAEIERIFNRLIYDPIRAALREVNIEILNSKDPIAEAIKSRRINFQEGKFYGEFSAKISKRFRELGGKFNRVSKTWELPNALPPDVSVAIAQIRSVDMAVKAQVISALDAVQVDNVISNSDIPKLYDATITAIDDDFTSAVSNISIPPKLTPAMKKVIADEWGQNLELYIKSWADENILKLREIVQTNTFNGQRAENLIGLIQDNYGTSKAKAKFLARQETSLLMAKMRETRYKSIGVTKYKWSTSHDERVRTMHKELDNKIFSFDSPPITNKNGDRNNPGEDFGCRCVAIPILE